MQFLSEKPIKVNYVYFSFVFLFLSVMSLTLLLSIDHPFIHHKIFFAIYNLLQVISEVLLLFFFSHIIQAVSKKLHLFYVAFVFVLLLNHLADFIIARWMGSNIFISSKILFALGLKHFIATMQACSLNPTMNWSIIFSFLFVPPIGVFLYRFSFRLIRKKSLFVSPKKIFLWLVVAIFSTCAFDFIGRWTLNPDAHTKLKTALLFHTTLFKPSGYQTNLPQKFICMPSKKAHEHLSDTIRPNIFLFVVETFRKDYINKQFTPHLYDFSKENISFALSLANANASSLSWFSIFNAHFPYHWKDFQKEKGSLALRHLKELDYQIHVYSSADLTYFNMKELLFGEKQQLVHFHDFSKTNHSADQRDLLTLKALQKDLQHAPKNANAFIIFLDATHSEYRWPKTFPTKFVPIIEKIDYLSLHPIKNDLEKIKNRYRNSVHFIDHLFSEFFSSLKQQNLYDSSVIVITGDHGEEFFEHGALFHGSHINLPQIHVPIIYKLPHNFQKAVTTKMTSHIDIFPSIFHIITDSNQCEMLFEGQSIFSNKRRPFILAFQQNGGDTPDVFFLHNGMHMMTARFLQNKEKIEVLSIKDKDEKQIMSAFSKKEIASFFEENFLQAFTCQ